MLIKRAKFILTALFVPVLLLVPAVPAYAASFDLPCDGSSLGSQASEGDSVSFSSSNGATSVSLSTGETLAMGESSSGLPAGTVSFSDDCGDSGSISVSAAATPPPVGSTTTTPPPSSGTPSNPNSSATTKPPDTPPADPTATLSANTDQPNHASNSSTKKSGPAASSQVKKAGLSSYKKFGLPAGAVLLIGAICFGIYRLISRRGVPKPGLINRPAVSSVPQQSIPLPESPVVNQQPQIEAPQQTYRYQQPPDRVMGGRFAIGG